MKIRAIALTVLAVLLCLGPVTASAQITAFTEDLESLDINNPDALGNAGWVVFGNVFDTEGNYLYGYGTFPAPNNPTAPAFCTIVTGQGGVDQGANQLSVFSDYENGDHANGFLVESNVFQEFTVGAGDVGKTWTFGFEAKMGELVAPSTALAFIKTLDPTNGYATTNFITEDMTNTPVEWSGATLSLLIDASLEGQLFQVGFSCSATNYDGSSIIYDNISLADDGGGTGGDGMVAYSQDFEALNADSPTALGDEGWLVYGNVFDGEENVLYSYGPFDAPNNPSSPAFCTIVTGEGGPEQGDQQLSVFSDYENADHALGYLIESNVYREQIIGSDDVGKTWIFEFQAKKPFMNGVTPPATAAAYIKTLDPSSGYSMTNYVTVDMTNINDQWGGYSCSLAIDAGLVGQIFQIGFTNTSTLYQSTAVIYDNLVMREGDLSPVTAPAVLSAKLGQNYPNPFNPSTRIQFTLEQPGHVQLAVYDIAGRLVTELVNAEMAAGDHGVTWNGKTRSGASAASGQYQYVMKTADGVQSRSMVLLK